MKFVAYVWVVGLILLCACGQNSDALYTQTILQHRGKITYNFLDKSVSPLTPQQLQNFKGLPYFEVNKGYLVQAKFTRNTAANWFAMPHTQNKTYNYLPVGTLSFEINGKAMQLMAYLHEGVNPTDTVELMVPFTDLTNGKLTYEGGRLLDVKANLNASVIWVDFNLAYNPYCAYNPDYSCPIPPKQNHLPIAVEAGEKYKPMY